MFFKTGILKICSTFTAEICQGAILIKLRSNFIEILLRHGCFPVDLLHISRIPFSKKTRGGLLLKSIERDMWFPKWHLLEIKEKKPSLFDCASSVNKIKNRKIKLLVLKKSIKDCDFKNHFCFVDASSCRQIVWLCLTILWGWRLKG